MINGLRYKKLKEVCIISPPKNEAREALSESDLVSFAPMSDLGIDTKQFIPTTKKPLGEVIKSYTYFAEGDVILAKITPCFENGKLGIATNLKNGVGFGSSEYVVYRPKEELLNEYLYYFLSQPSFRIEGADRMVGAVGHKRIPKDFYEETEIPIPPFPEQKRIVAILDEAFAAIDQAQDNAEKNLKNANEILVSFSQEVFVTLFHEQEQTTLGETCEFFNGKAHEKAIDVAGNFVVVNSKFISSEGSTIKKTANQLFPLYTNDIVMVMSDVPNGKALAKCTIIDEDYKYSLNQRICCIRSENFDTTFLYYQLNRHPYLLAFNNGENQTNLRKGDILNTPLSLPKIELQRKIAVRLEEVKEQAKQLENVYQEKLHDLEEFKKSILQKAFQGELEIEKELETI